MHIQNFTSDVGIFQHMNNNFWNCMWITFELNPSQFTHILYLSMAASGERLYCAYMYRRQWAVHQHNMTVSVLVRYWFAFRFVSNKLEFLISLNLTLLPLHSFAVCIRAIYPCVRKWFLLKPNEGGHKTTPKTYEDVFLFSSFWISIWFGLWTNFLTLFI